MVAAEFYPAVGEHALLLSAFALTMFNIDDSIIVKPSLYSWARHSQHLRDLGLSPAFNIIRRYIAKLTEAWRQV